MTGAPVVEVSGVQKAYGALRPLRLQQLTVLREEAVALLGFDAPAAEVFVNLVTGAALPDEGEIRVFGKRTAEITDSTEWLAWLERLGILSDRAVLLDGLTVAQNLAMTLTLEVEPIPASVRSQVEGLAFDVGLAPEMLERPVGAVPPDARVRVRLGRAVALGAELLILEHPTASLDASDVASFASDLRRLASARHLTLVAVTADEGFARGVAPSVLRHVPATGALVPHEGALGKVKRLFGRS